MNICPPRPKAYININGRRYNLATWYDGFLYDEKTLVVEYINSRGEVIQIPNVSQETYQKMAQTIEDLYS